MQCSYGYKITFLYQLINMSKMHAIIDKEYMLMQASLTQLVNICF